MASNKLRQGVPQVVGLFLVSACLVMTFDARPVCEGGKKPYYNQVSDKDVCCWDILCHKGEQPMPCSETSPNPTCMVCSEYTYQPVARRLSDASYRNCRAKTRCNNYRDKGTTTTNAKCGCQPDKFDSGDGICLPRPECPPGEGQTMIGRCERCVEGETFSARASFTEHCMPVTNCKARSKCLLKNATIISDNECGPITVDLRLCKMTSSTEKARKTTMPMHHENKPTPPSSQTPSKDLGAGATFGIVFSFVVAFIICLAVYLLVRRRRRHQKKLKSFDLLTKHTDIARAVLKAADFTTVLNDVLEIVFNYLADEEPGKWQILGNILMKNFSRFESDIKDRDIQESEKMREMLEEWKSQCRTNGPDLEYLFSCMYSPKNRKKLGYKFEPLDERILDRYGSTLGVTNDDQRPRPPHSLMILCCPRESDGSEFSSDEQLLNIIKKNPDTLAYTDKGTVNAVDAADDDENVPSVIFSE